MIYQQQNFDPLMFFNMYLFFLHELAYVSTLVLKFKILDL